MTVSELIEKLKEMPQDKNVWLMTTSNALLGLSSYAFLTEVVDNDWGTVELIGEE